jgi:hypothetical protein
MCMATRIKTENLGHRDVRCTIELEEPGEGADIHLGAVIPELVDPKLFKRTTLPATAILYKVGTSDPQLHAHILDIPSEKKIVLCTTNGFLTEYSGLALKDVVLQAYNDGALSSKR